VETVCCSIDSVVILRTIAIFMPLKDPYLFDIGADIVCFSVVPLLRRHFIRMLMKAHN